MLIHWCLKGIRGGGGFGDVEALSVLTATGIQSNWMHANAGVAVAQGNIVSQNVLNLAALDDHVNDYGSVRRSTPYISLSAGCRESGGSAIPATTYPAYRTALEFATDWGTTSGYVYRCWVVTAPQVAADVPGIADEVRDLNLFADFYLYHFEGEVVAKIVVPVRQIHWVQKVGADLQPMGWFDGHGPNARRNPNFRRPQTISNLIPELS